MRRSRRRRPPALTANDGRSPVKTLDEMLSLRLLSPEQHHAIGAYVAQARTPEAILQMPEPLWRALSLASVLMNLDAELLQPPLLEA
jgi:hypothetical protein